MNVLITGGCGVCGTALTRLPFDLTFLDREDAVPALEGRRFIHANLNDPDALDEALRGRDAVVHLAGAPHDAGDDAIRRDNIRATERLVEAAARAGVRTIVFASTHAVVGMHERDHAPGVYEVGHPLRLDHHTTPRPDSPAAVSKLHGEMLGRYAAESGGPRFVALRLGIVRPADEDHPYAPPVRESARLGAAPEPIERAVPQQRLKALWQSRRDFAHMVERCLLAERRPPFEVFYAVSDNDRRWLDLDHARDALGYAPRDNAEGWVIPRDDAARAADTAPPPPPPERCVAIISFRDPGPECREAFAPLLAASVDAAAGSARLGRVVVATDTDDAASFAERLGAAAPFVRPPELSAPHVRADTVLQHALATLERSGVRHEIVAPLEITHPFRPPGLLDELIERLSAEDLDTVIAGAEEYRPVWVRRSGRLQRVDEYSRLRDRREPVHVGLPSLACVTRAGFVRAGSRLGSRIGFHPVGDPIARAEIRSPEDLDAALAAMRRVAGETARP